MLLWMTNAMQSVKISLRITKDIKIQDGRQSLFKIVFGIRIHKFAIMLGPTATSIAHYF